ncbi:MAG: nuclear transport factor 2 family protein [Notoacmeibacter sp.]|nr:nuclear transport factor 2 family protein [Notoacmeibacter sp.]
MCAQQLRSTLDHLRHGIETRDATEIAGLYADNAVMQIIDQTHPPSNPQRIEGRKQIAAFFDDICGREMTHKVRDVLSDDGHLAFCEECEYPDGTHVFMSAFAELANGRIVKQTNVQAWDA